MTDQGQNPASTPLTGRVVRRGEPGWERARRNFNARIDPQSVEPKMIVFVQNAADVRHALAYARANQLPFRVRCGGHSYEAYSLVKDGLVIDVSDMNHVIYDPATGHVTVGAGARCLDVAERRRPQDGHLGLTLDGRPIELRVSVLPTNHGEAVESPPKITGFPRPSPSAPHRFGCSVRRCRFSISL